MDDDEPTSGLDPNQVLWSDPTSWASGSIPQDGESIVIPANVNMVLDLAETPILGRLEINGRLTFKNNMDINLRSKLIWVRKGEFFIGSSTVPYLNEGKITLYGDQDSETLVVSPSITAGNKVLANTGILEIYGKERSRTARL